jgi:hypothetical protein
MCFGCYPTLKDLLEPLIMSEYAIRLHLTGKEASKICFMRAGMRN